MTHSLVRLWRNTRFSLMMAFGTLPIPGLLTAYYAPGFLPWVWLWPLTYVLLDSVGTAARKKWRLLYGMGQLAAMAVLAWQMRPESGSAYWIPVLYSVLLLLGLALTPGSRNERIATPWYLAGILTHLAGQVLLYSARVLQNPAPDPIAPWLTAGFFLFVLLGLLTMNQAGLSAAASGRQSVSRTMQRKNLLLTLAFFAIALGVALIPAAASAVSAGLKGLLAAIVWLLSKLHWSGGGSSGGQVNMPDMPGDGPMTDAPVSYLPAWVEQVLVIGALLLAAGVLLYLGYRLLGKLSVLGRYLKRLLTRYIHAVSEDYVDEITDTREDTDQSLRRSRSGKKLSAAAERSMTPEQRIRYRYRLLLHRHPEWDAGSTAREKLPEAAATVYERVRYGQYAPSEEDAQQFTEEIKKLPGRRH